MNQRTAAAVSGAGIGIALGLAVNRAFREVAPNHADRVRPLPGDPGPADPEPMVVTDRAILIAASPEVVWPWVVQMGYQRAGWYSHDLLERLLGVASYRDGDLWGWRSSRSVVPELQDLREGDVVPLGPGADLVAAHVEPGRRLLLTGTFGSGQMSLRWAWSWALDPVGPGGEGHATTRLQVRTTITAAPVFAPVVRTVLRVGHAEMERSQLVNIRARVEESA